MEPSKTLRFLVIALLAVAILLTAGSSVASSKEPPGAIGGLAGRPTMAGGDYALTYQLQRAAGAMVSRPAALASGGSYQITAPVQPAADASGCCCRCRLPYMTKK